MPESPFAREQCQQCGCPTTRDGVTEYFELRHTHQTEGERIQVAGPVPGKQISVPMPNLDISSNEELLGFFCSARCLTEFVAARIAPDAAGEG